MHWNDVINGGFELCGGLFLLLNVCRLLKDRQLRGVSWIPTVFFTAWGYWNLYFYPSVGAWWSFGGGCLIVLVNTWWVGLAVYFWLRRLPVIGQ